MRFAAYDPITGQIAFQGDCPEDQLQYQGGPGLVVIEGDFHWKTHYWNGTEMVEFPAKPSAVAKWLWGSKAWAVDLGDVRAAKWAEIKAARDAAELGGFTAGGLVYDSDEISTRRINGAFSLAMDADRSGLPYSETWTLKDNSIVTLDAAGMIEVGRALGEHVKAVHAHARELREAIEAASTVAEVEAIAW